MSSQNDLFTQQDHSACRVFEINDISPSPMSPLSLFEGFSIMRCITYSYSLPFIAELCDQFEQIEIILGSPKTIQAERINGMIQIESLSLELQEEYDLVEKIHKLNNLYPSIRDKTRFRVMIGKPSHEKLYLLSNSDTNRVVWGSGNLSFASMHQMQHEIIMFSDNPQTFQAFEKIYEEAVAQSGPITLKHANDKQDSDKIEPNELPLIQQSVEKSVKITGTDEIQERALKFILPKRDPEKPRIVTQQQILKAIPKLSLAKNIPMDKKCFEPIIFDFDDMSITKGQNKIHQGPVIKDDLNKDIQIINDWFSQYREAQFTGDKESAIRGFEILLTFAMASPFLSALNHHSAKETGQAYLYPIFAVMFGPSSGGKSSFVQMLKPLTMRSAVETRGIKFSPLSFEKYQISSAMGLITLDDIALKSVQNHLDAIVKKDEVAQSSLLAPCILTTNKDVNSLEASVLKRVLPIWIDATTEVKNAKRRPKIGLGLFRSFLESAHPIYERHLNDSPNERFLNEVSALWGEFGLDIKPITSEELTHRATVPIKRKLETLLEEKRKNGKLTFTTKDVAITFDDANEAKSLMADLPMSFQPRLGENTLLIKIDSVISLGIDLGFIQKLKRMILR